MPVHKREYTQQGAPVWYYEFWYNKLRYHKTGFATKKEADNAEATRRRDILDKRLRPVDPKHVTFNLLLPKFLEYRTTLNAMSTQDRETRRARSLEAFFGNMVMTETAVGHVQDFVVRRKADGLKPRTINLELTLLRNIFKYAVQNNYATTNPAREVTHLKTVKEEKWIPTKEEMERFVRCAAGTRSGKVMVPWAWFMAYAGTRPSEAYHMEWADIDFSRDLIHIRPKEGHELKNRKYRVVNMHPELKPILLAYRRIWEETFSVRSDRHPDEPESPPHDYVFYNPSDQRERVMSFNKCFYKARNAAGLPKLTPHGFRHFFISYCLMSGILPQTIAKWAGHSSTKMIEETYGHLIPDFKAEEMKKLSFEVKKTVA